MEETREAVPWGGLDTYREMFKVRPDQRAIVASGFSETERVREAQGLGAGTFLGKPYTLSGIGKAVREELDRNRIEALRSGQLP